MDCYNMKEAFQILHIPSGNYVSSKNRENNNNSVIFANEETAQVMISYIVNQKEYIFGAPITDFSIGDISVTQSFVEAEFLIIPMKVYDIYYNISKILTT